MSGAEREVVTNDGAVEIDMAERNGDLQQKRRKRKICAAPFMTVNPSHARMLMLYCYTWQEELLRSIALQVFCKQVGRKLWRRAATALSGLGIDQHEGDNGGLGGAVAPGMIGAALDEHVARFQQHLAFIHHRVDFAR